MTSSHPDRADSAAPRSGQGIFDPDQLSQCVQCGFCLSSCPTYEVTHLEEHGPRGRILGMRLVAEGEFTIDHPDVLDSLETCVQCRACEEVCPSLVEFGALMEDARAAMRDHAPPQGTQGRAQQVGYATLPRRGLLKTGILGLSALQATRADRLLPDHLRVARRVRARDVLRPLRDDRHAPGTPAFVFRGCVMDGLFRDVHQATVDVLAAAGYAPSLSPAPPCCGALHIHAGREHEAHRLAQEVIDAYEGTEGPIVVDSGGCGAAMKEYGEWLGTAQAEAFSARVQDLTEVIEPSMLAGARPVRARMAYQSPCHQKNVQRLGDTPRALLSAIPGLEVVEPDDWHLCCGSGGAYSLLQPELGDALLDKKTDALTRTGCTDVISGNPGCALQIARGGFRVWHPAHLLARALRS